MVRWEANGSRITVASFRTMEKTIKMNVIQCYMPTNDKGEEAKDWFYSRWQNVMAKYPEKDVKILMGDLNAKIGQDNTRYEEVMGRHGLGEMRDLQTSVLRTTWSLVAALSPTEEYTRLPGYHHIE